MTMTSQDLPLSERLRALTRALQEGLVERDIPMRLAVLAALSGEHLLFIGPPGTAKSLLARRLHLAFREARYFEYLLTRFTVPDELFGPLSIKALEQDRYERLVDRYLPSAAIAFLDEIFKANSAILNALLTLLNEREFDNGGRRGRTPLVSVVGASNELPEGEELEALYDRFLLRLHIGPVTDAGFDALLDLRDTGPFALDAALQLDAEVLEAVRRGARSVRVPPNVRELLKRLRTWAAGQSMVISDRRWRKIVNLLQVAAFTDGRDEVSIWDCWLLQFCACHNPKQSAEVLAWYEDVVGKTETADPGMVTAVVTAWEKRLEVHRSSQSQAMDGEGRPLFRGPKGPVASKTAKVYAVNATGEPLYLGPANLHPIDRTNSGAGFTQGEIDNQWNSRTQYYSTNWPGRADYYANPANRLKKSEKLQPLMEPTRWSAAHIDSCVAQLDTARGDVDRFLETLDHHLASLTDAIERHVWIDGSFVTTARRNLEAVRRTAEHLKDRADTVRNGFMALPRLVERELALPGTAPLSIADNTAHCEDDAELDGHCG